MKHSKKDLIYRMEVEDDLGIKRGVKRRLVLPNKAYILLKLCLIASLPAVYFLCSPLLVLVVLAYFGLVFVTNGIEKNFNLGLKKELRVQLPKTDSLLCLLLVIIAVTGMVVSSVSGQQGSMFEGFVPDELEEIIEAGDFSSSDFARQQVLTRIRDFGTLMTGTRYLFQEQQTFGGGMMAPPDGFDPPEGFEPPSDVSVPDISELLEDLPFSIMFSSIVKAVNSALLVLICVCGLLSIRKFKKLTAA